MKHLLCALLILSNALSPLAYAGDGGLAMDTVVEKKESAESCETQVTAKSEFKYKPVGYVTGSIVNQLTSKTPLLFTKLYFKALGNALNRSGFNKVANSKGVFNENISKIDKQRVQNVVEGKSDQSLQSQGKIATLMWEFMVNKLNLNGVLGSDNDIKKAAAMAEFDSSDEYILVHDFLLQNMTHKAEVIELIRLSLPYGVSMAAEGFGGSLSKSVFFTATTTVATGFFSYLLLKLNAMLGNPAGSGVLPLLLPAVVAPLSGAAMFIYTAPKSMFQKLQVRLMNYSNRRSLIKRGLISKEDGESIALIKATFKDLGELRNQVNVKDIQAVFPIPPTSADLQTIESSMLKFADKLGGQVAAIGEFQNEVAAEMQEHARQMGQPLYSLARLLQVKPDQTSYEIPAQSRVAIQEFAEQLIKAHEMLSEIESEYNALLNQYDMHIQVLQSFYDQSESNLKDRAKSIIQQKLATMEQAKVAIQTLLNVATAQKNTLEDDKQGLDVMLNVISVISGKSALTTTQAKSFNDAFWKLTRKVDKAQQNDITDAELIPTVETGSAQ